MGCERRKLVQQLHVNRTEGCTTKAMDYAVFSGHLYDDYALRRASKKRHFEVVNDLHLYYKKNQIQANRHTKVHK